MVVFPRVEAQQEVEAGAALDEVGVMEEAAYATSRTTLMAGEKLVAFTDGVTEAMDAQQNLFGTARLGATLARAADASPDALDRTVMDTLRIDWVICSLVSKIG